MVDCAADDREHDGDVDGENNGEDAGNLIGKRLETWKTWPVIFEEHEYMTYQWDKGGEETAPSAENSTDTSENLNNGRDKGDNEDIIQCVGSLVVCIQCILELIGV